MNYKLLFGFEISKILIGILNIIFLVEQCPELSLIISIISIITSVAVAGAVVEKEEVKPKKIKRCPKCKQEVVR